VPGTMPNIHDVETRELQVNIDERGHLVEMFRDDWAEYDETPAMSYYSVTHRESSGRGTGTSKGR